MADLMQVFIFGVLLPTIVTVLLFVAFLICWFKFDFRERFLRFCCKKKFDKPAKSTSVTYIKDNGSGKCCCHYHHRDRHASGSAHSHCSYSHSHSSSVNHNQNANPGFVYDDAYKPLDGHVSKRFPPLWGPYSTINNEVAQNASNHHICDMGHGAVLPAAGIGGIDRNEIQLASAMNPHVPPNSDSGTYSIQSGPTQDSPIPSTSRPREQIKPWGTPPFDISYTQRDTSFQSNKSPKRETHFRPIQNPEETVFSHHRNMNDSPLWGGQDDTLNAFTRTYSEKAPSLSRAHQLARELRPVRGSAHALPAPNTDNYAKRSQLEYYFPKSARTCSKLKSKNSGVMDNSSSSYSSSDGDIYGENEYGHFVHGARVKDRGNKNALSNGHVAYTPAQVHQPLNINKSPPQMHVPPPTQNEAHLFSPEQGFRSDVRNNEITSSSRSYNIPPMTSQSTTNQSSPASVSSNDIALVIRGHPHRDSGYHEHKHHRHHHQNNADSPEFTNCNTAKCIDIGGVHFIQNPGINGVSNI